MKTLRLLLFLSLSFFSLVGSAQTFYTKFYTESFSNCIKLTNDSGYLSFGYFYTNNTRDNFLLIKLDKYGDTVFCKTYGDSAYMYGLKVLVLSNGDFMLMGNRYGNIVLIKTDSMGNILWNKSYDATSSLIASNICITPDGGFTILGNNQPEFFLFKVDSTGNLLWAKKNSQNVGLIGRQIISDSQGGYLISGTSSGGANFFTFLLYADSSGTILWNKELANFELGLGNSLLQNSDGSIIMIGSQKYSSNNYCAALIKTDNFGNSIWAHTYKGLIDEHGYAVSTTFDKGYIISGATFNSTTALYPVDVCLIKTDSNGIASWGKRFGLTLFNDWGESVIQDIDSGFIVVGGEGQFGVSVKSKIFILKTDTVGNVSCITNNNLPLIQNSGTFNITSTTFIDSAMVLNIDSILPIFVSQNLTNYHCPLTTEVENKNKFDDVVIFPNPSNGIFKIQFQNNLAEGVCLITNVFGQTIWKKEILNQNSVDVNLEDSPNGIYFLSFTGKDYEIKGKLILSK